MAFRERQLLTNLQMPVLQNGPFSQGYSYSQLLGHPLPPYGCLACQPVSTNNRKVCFSLLCSMIHVPVVNQGSQYLQTKISVSVIHSDSITQSSAPAPQSTARTKAQEQSTSKTDSVYHRRAQNGKGGYARTLIT